MQDASLYYQYWDYSEEGAIYADNVVANEDAMFYSHSRNLDNPILIAADMSTDNYDIGEQGTSRDFYVFGDDVFTEIISMSIGGTGNVWILDGVIQDDGSKYGKVGIFEYDTEWAFEDKWDINISNVNRSFLNPTDLTVKGGMVYISCSDADNKPIIKVLTEVGSYVRSISDKSLTETIDSVAVTNNHIVALSDKKLYIFDHESNLVRTVTFDDDEIRIYAPTRYTYDDEANLTKLIDNTNGSFFYGIADNLIYKFGESGEILESFGETAINYMNINETDDLYKTITNAYHDVNYNLYVSTKYDIIKYYDRVSEQDRLLRDLSYNIEESEWSISNSEVDSEENTSAWVYNRIFNRILDNLNIFRLSLKGSLSLIKTKTFEKVTVDNFNVDEYKQLTHTKDEIQVGINEIHCEGALNRCIRQLNTCFEDCLGYLNYRDSGIDPDLLVLDELLVTNPEGEYNVAEGIWYFDYGRVIGNFTFTWDDGFIHRWDKTLKGSMTLPAGTDVGFGYPTPLTYTDDTPYLGLDDDTLTWKLNESYVTITETASASVKFQKRIFMGSMPIGDPITDVNIVNQNNTIRGATTIFKGLTADYNISVPENYRYYIAIPTEEVGSTKLVHPDLGWEYESTVLGEVYISEFKNEYQGIAPYTVMTLVNNSFETDDIVYRSDVKFVKFRLIRGV